MGDNQDMLAAGIQGGFQGRDNLAGPSLALNMMNQELKSTAFAVQSSMSAFSAEFKDALRSFRDSLSYSLNTLNGTLASLGSHMNTLGAKIGSIGQTPLQAPTTLRDYYGSAASLQLPSQPQGLWRGPLSDNMMRFAANASLPSLVSGITPYNVNPMEFSLERPYALGSRLARNTVVGVPAAAESLAAGLGSWAAIGKIGQTVFGSRWGGPAGMVGQMLGYGLAGETIAKGISRGVQTIAQPLVTPALSNIDFADNMRRLGVMNGMDLSADASRNLARQVSNMAYEQNQMAGPYQARIGGQGYKEILSRSLDAQLPMAKDLQDLPKYAREVGEIAKLLASTLNSPDVKSAISSIAQLKSVGIDAVHNQTQVAKMAMQSFTYGRQAGMTGSQAFNEALGVSANLGQATGMPGYAMFTPYLKQVAATAERYRQGVLNPVDISLGGGSTKSIAERTTQAYASMMANPDFQMYLAAGYDPRTGTLATNPATMRGNYFDKQAAGVRKLASNPLNEFMFNADLPDIIANMSKNGSLTSAMKDNLRQNIDIEIAPFLNKNMNSRQIQSAVVGHLMNSNPGMDRATAKNIYDDLYNPSVINTVDYRADRDMRRSALQNLRNRNGIFEPWVETTNEWRKAKDRLLNPIRVMGEAAGQKISELTGWISDEDWARKFEIPDNLRGIRGQALTNLLTGNPRVDNAYKEVDRANRSLSDEAVARGVAFMGRERAFLPRNGILGDGLLPYAATTGATIATAATGLSLPFAIPGALAGTAIGAAVGFGVQSWDRMRAQEGLAIAKYGLHGYNNEIIGRAFDTSSARNSSPYLNEKYGELFKNSGMLLGDRFKYYGIQDSELNRGSGSIWGGFDLFGTEKKSTDSGTLGGGIHGLTLDEAIGAMMQDKTSGYGYSEEVMSKRISDYEKSNMKDIGILNDEDYLKTLKIGQGENKTVDSLMAYILNRSNMMEKLRAQGKKLGLSDDILNDDKRLAASAAINIMARDPENRRSIRDIFADKTARAATAGALAPAQERKDLEVEWIRTHYANASEARNTLGIGQIPSSIGIGVKEIQDQAELLGGATAADDNINKYGWYGQVLTGANYTLAKSLIAEADAGSEEERIAIKKARGELLQNGISNVNYYIDKHFGGSALAAAQALGYDNWTNEEDKKYEEIKRSRGKDAADQYARNFLGNRLNKLQTQAQEDLARLGKMSVYELRKLERNMPDGTQKSRDELWGDDKLSYDQKMNYDLFGNQGNPQMKQKLLGAMDRAEGIRISADSSILSDAIAASGEYAGDSKVILDKLNKIRELGSGSDRTGQTKAILSFLSSVGGNASSGTRALGSVAEKLLDRAEGDPNAKINLDTFYNDLIKNKMGQVEAKTFINGLSRFADDGGNIALSDLATHALRTKITQADATELKKEDAKADYKSAVDTTVMDSAMGPVLRVYDVSKSKNEKAMEAVKGIESDLDKAISKHDKNRAKAEEKAKGGTEEAEAEGLKYKLKKFLGL